MSNDPALLHASNLSKSYRSVHAVRNASLKLYPGEVHGLVGENGAGKSTLVRLLTGIEQPDTGEVSFARPAVIAVVPQYPHLADSLRVWQNLIVGNEPHRGPFLDAKRGLGHIQRIACHYDIALDVNRPARELGETEVRLAALLAALLKEPDILILDEPTVGLSLTDQAAIVDSIRRFRDEDHAVLYISHDLSEIARLSARVTPLSQGVTSPPWYAPIDPQRLARHLFGESPTQHDTTPSRHATLATTRAQEGYVLHLKEAVIRHPTLGRSVGPLSLSLQRGSLSAITGVRESGLDLIERYLTGEAVLEHGEVRLLGVRLPTRVEPHRLRRKGLTFIPSDRFDRAAALTGSVEENAILHERFSVHPKGIFARRGARRITATLMRIFGLGISRRRPLQDLSGGTIQKIILSRELLHDPAVCVIAEPTSGLDVRSQTALEEIIREVATRGTAVLVVTSTIQTACAMGDVVHVLHAGQLRGSFAYHEKSAILHAFAGLQDTKKESSQ